MGFKATKCSCNKWNSSVALKVFMQIHWHVNQQCLSAHMYEHHVWAYLSISVSILVCVRDRENKRSKEICVLMFVCFCVVLSHSVTHSACRHLHDSGGCVLARSTESLLAWVKYPHRDSQALAVRTDTHRHFLWRIPALFSQRTG